MSTEQLIEQVLVGHMHEHGRSIRHVVDACR
jgi:hypothetical protein